MCEVTLSSNSGTSSHLVADSGQAMLLQNLIHVCHEGVKRHSYARISAVERQPSFLIHSDLSVLTVHKDYSSQQKEVLVVRCANRMPQFRLQLLLLLRHIVCDSVQIVSL